MNRVHARRGITLIEVTTVSGLMSVLAMMIASTWAGMGRPTVDVVFRNEVFQELDSAIAALSLDLGGGMAGPEARLGGKTKYRWVGWESDGDNLKLCFDAGTNPNEEPDWEDGDDTIVTYSVSSETLVREIENTGQTFTVAKYIKEFSISPVSSDMISITLRLEKRDISRTCTLLVRTPEN